MKRLFPALYLLAVLFSGCRYDEPSFSLNSPENRLIGYWLLQVVEKNGEKITDPGEYFANKPGNYYSFFFDGPFAVTTMVDKLPIESVKGIWILTDKNRKLDINFTLKNREYIYIADIIKLSNKELKYKYIDSEGNKWYLEMYKR